MYEDGAVAYLRETGDTHELSAAASSILDALRRLTLDQAGLLGYLGGRGFDLDSSQLQRLLDDLEDLGLVERAET